MKERLPTMCPYAIQALCIPFIFHVEESPLREAIRYATWVTQSVCLIWIQRFCESTVKIVFGKEMVSLMLSGACVSLGRHRHPCQWPVVFLLVFTVCPVFLIFHSPGGELVSAVAVS